MPQKMRYGVIVYLDIPADLEGVLPVYNSREVESMVMDALTSKHHRIDGVVDCELLSTEVLGMGLPPVQPCIACHGRGTLAPIEEAGGWIPSCGACKGTGAQP